MKRQDGVGVVEGLVIVLILSLLAGAGWYVWNSRENKSTTRPGITANNDGVRNDLKSVIKGVSVTFKDKEAFDEGDIDEINKRIVNPMIYYDKVIIKSDLASIIISRAQNQLGPNDYRYSFAYYSKSIKDEFGFLFGYNKKIEYWQPQLCDPGGCQPYPEELKKEFPETYQAYIKCEEENAVSQAGNKNPDPAFVCIET